MGYDLHITRRASWSDEDGLAITLAEWQQLVADDPELAFDSGTARDTASWSGDSTLDEPWLMWCDGEVRTKNPDEALIRKMIALAAQLDAQVQGDDGEVYRIVAGDIQSSEDDDVGRAGAATPARSAWELWHIRHPGWAYFLIAGLLLIVWLCIRWLWKA
jgi:hypothetical protein